MAGGGALMLGGVITGILTLGIESDLESQCDAMGRCPESARSDRDSGETLALVTDVLLIGGVVVVGVGVALFLLDDGDAGVETESPQAAAACGPDGCAASLRVRF
jgi:hypothetical protein